jgi:hypothetical protein
MIGPSSAQADRPLHEQLAHLRLLERAAAAANQFGILEDAAQVVLEEVCQYTGWPVGHLYAAAGLRGPNAAAGLRGPNAAAGLRGPNAVAASSSPAARVSWAVPSSGGWARSTSGR